MVVCSLVRHTWYRQFSCEIIHQMPLPHMHIQAQRYTSWSTPTTAASAHWWWETRADSTSAVPIRCPLQIFQISKAMKKTCIIFFLTTECHKFWETRRCIALMKCVKINKFMILHMSVCVLTWHKHKARNLILIIQGVWWSWVQLQAMAEPAWGSTRSSLTV